MNLPEDSNNETIEPRDLLHLLSRTEKYFEDIKIAPDLLLSYKKLVRYLRSQPKEKLCKILGLLPTKDETETGVSKGEMSAAKIAAMDSEEILRLARNPDFPRKQLERIAALRFGVTKGALSALRNKEALVEKINSLVENEATHESITRVASSKNAD